MGRELIYHENVFKTALMTADVHFKSLGASWSLIDELLKPVESSRVNSAAIGQPLCTALQCALVDLLESWSIKPASATGHSSGEIAAAYACGAITFKSALTISYHRGHLASTMLEKGKLRGAMIAVGLSEAEAEAYIAQIPNGKGKAVVACVNSPRSVTVSGDRSAIMSLQSILEARQIFVRRLGVNTAYHSHHMEVVADHYLAALQKLPKPRASNTVLFFSSVTGGEIDGQKLNAAYWVKNMVSPVQFSQSLLSLCQADKSNGAAMNTSWTKPAVDFLLEVGPHSGLAGFVKQNLAALEETKVKYTSSLIRSKDAVKTMLDLASDLAVNGYPVELKAVNFTNSLRQPQVLVDLPSYPWDHSTSYWHESRLSLNYRKRSAPRHPLLGAPTSDFNLLEPNWRNIVQVSEIPWIRGHVVQSNIVYPAAGYVAMVIEAAKQRSRLSGLAEAVRNYRLKDVKIFKTLLVPDNSEGIETMCSLRPYNRSARKSSDVWDEFRIFSYTQSEGWSEHCRGLVTVQHKLEVSEVEGDGYHQSKLASYKAAIEGARVQCQGVIDPSQLYETLNTFGLEFQDCFKCIEDVVVSSDQSLGTIRIPDTAAVMPKRVEHPHIIHPATLDACMQMTSPPLVKAGTLQAPMVPTFIEEIAVSSDVPKEPGEQLLVHTSTTLAGKRSSKSSLTAISQPRGATQAPHIQISGLICTPIPGGLDSTAQVDK